MRLNLLELKDFAEKLQTNGMEEAYLTYAVAPLEKTLTKEEAESGEEPEKMVRVSIILERKIEDTIVTYNELIGTEKDTEENRESLMKKAKERRSEISGLLLDHNITISEGYYE